MRIDYDKIQEGFFIAGPLNLDLHNKQVSTAYGVKINLSEHQFKMLYMLAIQEPASLSFQTIFDAISNDCNISCDKNQAYAEINELMDIIGKIGHGFMWIEQILDGYSFKTNWGRDLQKDSQIIIENPKKIEIEKKPVKNLRKLKGVYAGMATAAVMGVALIWAISNNPPQEIFTLEDPNVPLGYFNGSIVLPTIHDVTVSEIVEIPLYNPPENNFWLAFEVVLANTNQILYISDFFAPGTASNIVIPAEVFEIGDNKTVLNIHAYSFPSLTIQETSSTEFNVIRQISN